MNTIRLLAYVFFFFLNKKRQIHNTYIHIHSGALRHSMWGAAYEICELKSQHEISQSSDLSIKPKGHSAVYHHITNCASSGDRLKAPGSAVWQIAKHTDDLLPNVKTTIKCGERITLLMLTDNRSPSIKMWSGLFCDVKVQFLIPS